MNCGALQHPLEARCRLRVMALRCDKVGKLVVEVVQNLAPQPVEVGAARPQHGNRVLILGERQQGSLWVGSRLHAETQSGVPRRSSEPTGGNHASSAAMVAARWASLFLAAARSAGYFILLPQHARDRPLSSSFVFPPIAPSRWRNWARGALAVAASSFLLPPRATIRYSPSPSNWD